MSGPAKFVFAGAIALAFMFEPGIPGPSGGLWLQGSKAHAARGRPLTPVSVAGTTRRVSRRTARRTAYRNSVAGCNPYRNYYNCGGVYYAPTVQNGTTVYIVVNP